MAPDWPITCHAFLAKYFIGLTLELDGNIFQRRFKCDKVLVMVHWISTIFWLLIGQSPCKLLLPNPSLNWLITGRECVLATSPGVIKSWSWFTEFPIYPDFQLVKHIQSIYGQSLLIGLASSLLKKMLTASRGIIIQSKHYWQFACTILLQYYMRFSEIPLQFALNSPQIILIQ